MNAATSPADPAAARTLVRFYQRNGYLRRPDPERRKAERSAYKMGFEVRLVARSEEERAELQQAIRAAGLRPGKPFPKAHQWVVPIYGRAAMERFLAWVDRFGETP